MSPSDPTLLPEPVRASVEAELAPGEGIRWVAQPIPARMARASLADRAVRDPVDGLRAVLDVRGAAQGACAALRCRAPFVPALRSAVRPDRPAACSRARSGCCASAKRTVYVVTRPARDRDSRRLRGGVSVRSFEPEKLARPAPRPARRRLGRSRVRTGREHRARRAAATHVDYGFLAVPNVSEAEEYVRALARRAPPV